LGDGRPSTSASDSPPEEGLPDGVGGRLFWKRALETFAPEDVHPGAQRIGSLSNASLTAC
jgi:hypothetical protein